MQDKLLQTPDGVRDTYDVECKKKRKMRKVYDISDDEYLEWKLNFKI